MPLTVLFNYVLSCSNKISEALILIACHCAVTPSLKRQILLEMGIEMLFQSQVADKSHTADAALELDTLKYLDLGGQAWSIFIQIIHFSSFYRI